MIETHALTKRYGDFVALDDVSINVGPGEIVGLLGPNGAGKTTLIRTLTGYFEPSGGTVTVDGVDVVADPRRVQQVIGYLPEQTPLYPEMLVQEYLEMVADIRDLPRGDGRLRALAEAVWAAGLADQLTRPIGDLSKGYRQRVCLAQAILHQPKVLILDEPTSGLDPEQVVHVRELIRRLARKSTILFSTHILSEVEHVCERAIVLIGGKVRLDARLDAIRSGGGARVVIVDGPGVAGARDRLAALPGVSGVQSTSARAGLRAFELRAADSTEACRAAFRLARDAGWELVELHPSVRTLETVFRELIAEGEPPRASGGSPAEVRA